MTTKRTRDNKRTTLNRRTKLHNAQNGLCYYCQCPMNLGGRPNSPTATTIEHLTRKVENGGNAITNLAAACRACNSNRQDLPHELWKLVCVDIIAIRKRRKLVWRQYFKLKTHRKTFLKNLTTEQYHSLTRLYDKWIMKKCKLEHLFRAEYKYREVRLIKHVSKKHNIDYDPSGAYWLRWDTIFRGWSWLQWVPNRKQPGVEQRRHPRSNNRTGERVAA